MIREARDVIWIIREEKWGCVVIFVVGLSQLVWYMRFEIKILFRYADFKSYIFVRKHNFFYSL